MIKLYNVVRQYQEHGVDPDVFPIFSEHRPTMDKALDLVAEEMDFDDEDLDELKDDAHAGLVEIRGGYELPESVVHEGEHEGMAADSVIAAMGRINAHRRTVGQAPLDPKDWTPQDVLREAERIASLPNPGPYAPLKRSLMQ